MFVLDPEIRDQAYLFFTQESVELLQILEEGLLDLRQDRSVPKIHELMRAAHSIKGGAASIDLTSIQALAHQLEDVLRVLYRQEIEIDRQVEDLLLQAYDCLRSPLLEQVQTGNHDAEAALQRAEPVFLQLKEKLGDTVDLDASMPSSVELGVDIVQVVFTGDVEQGLQRLEQVLSSPETEEVAGEIRAQAEVFIGLGELLSLPGFTAIAKASIAALQAQPKHVLEIGRIALSNLRIAQMKVIGGDRTQGGEPDAALLSFTHITLDQEHNDHPDHPIDLNQNELDELDELDELQDESVDPDFFNILGILGDEDLEDAELEDDFFGQLADLDLGESSDPLFYAKDELEDSSYLTSSFILDHPGDVLNSDLPSLNHAIASANSLVVPVEVEEVALTLSSPSPLSQSPLPSPEQPVKLVSNTVRVDFARLERLNNLVGELVTQENSSLLQNQQLQETLTMMVQRFSHFEQITKELQDWSDRSQNERAKLQHISDRNTPFEAHAHVRSNASHASLQPLPPPPPPSPFSAFQADFDPLQMDSYSHLQTMVQKTIEEIAQLGEAMRDMALLTQQAQQPLRKKQQTLKQIRNDLLWARMLPVGDVLQRFPRMVRTLSNTFHKRVTLKLSGTATLVDKVLLEKLYDPLVHLVRNAFDHGIESPEERMAQGKSADATIEIRAYHRGNQTCIEVQDDGRGINLEEIRTKIISLNLMPASEVLTLPDDRLYNCLFIPGFSTAQKISELSGRGVGLDAVRSQVKSLKGTITVVSQPGKGTTFTLRLPLTLTIAKLLVFSLHSSVMALSVDSLVSIVTASADQIQIIQGKPFYRWHDQLIPLYTQSIFLQHYPLVRSFTEKPKAIPLPQDGKIPLLLVSGNSHVIALQVDHILQEQELVIKPFGSAIAPPPYLYGCTILGDGSLVPVIDGQALVAQQQSQPVETQIEPSDSAVLDPSHHLIPAIPSAPAIPLVLVVDDSLTTRQTLILTLKKAGYRTVQARDGREALEQLHRDTEIQAVFCDIEMPHMNGFEFLSCCRQEFPKSNLPVIMLTSRGSEKHRRVADLMGATAFLTKPYLEQDLLKTLSTSLSSHSSTSTPVYANH